MTKIPDIAELVRAYEKTKNNENMGNYSLIIDSVNFLLEYKDNNLTRKETIYGVEAIYDKIKVSIEKLADNLPKTIKHTNVTITEHINTTKKNLKKLENKYTIIDDTIKNLDEDKLNEIELIDVLPYELYQQFHKSIYAIFSIENSFAKDILKGKDDLTSQQMKTIIDTCENIHVNIKEDPMENSGYNFSVSKEYANSFIKKKRSLSDLGYNKKSVQKIYSDLKNYSKEINKKTKETIVEDIKKAATTILTDFNKLRNENVEISAKKIITTTVQLCRCYFYLKLLVELYNVIAWGPFYSSINVLQTLVQNNESDSSDTGDSLVDDSTDEVEEDEDIEE
jgi:hypothetical protein